MWLEFYRRAQFHITTPQRDCHSHYALEPFHKADTSLGCVYSNTCLRSSLTGSRAILITPTCAAVLTLLLISQTSEGWKAESTLPPPVFEHGNTEL